MDIELLKNMYFAAPELWYGIGILVLILVLIAIFFCFYTLRLKQKNYFLHRDRERYAETLYASHDGYYAFIYPDSKINDPRKDIKERCSRRLAVILGLEKGIRSNLEDILKNFYKDDEKKIQKYISLLRNEGIAFEDYFELKTLNKYIRLEGVRINGADGNIYCDMIWFRDVSFATNRIRNLEDEIKDTKQKYMMGQDILDNLPFSVWLRDDKLNIVYCNKKYVEFIPESSKEKIINEHIEIPDTAGESISKNLAAKAHKNNKISKDTTGVISNGNRIAMEAYEVPFYFEQNLEKTYSAGCLINIDELDKLRRNLKEYKNAQLEILGTLGTAFAVFNQDMSLEFYNNAFVKLWKLDSEWLQNKQSYDDFLDIAREKRILPEVPDYKAYRREEHKQFSQIIEPVSDLLHLPNGKTIRRMRVAYPMGGVVFAFEDISDRIATTSAYNALINLQNEILTNINDGVIIFGSNNQLSFFNDAYVKLWNTNKEFLDLSPDFDEVLNKQKDFFSQDGDWEQIKQAMSKNILDMTSKKMVLERNDGKKIQLSVAHLSNESLMIIYKIL